MRGAGSKRSRGQAMTEFAVIVPVVLLLLLALFDAGRGVMFYAELSNASRAGARVAIVNQSNDSTCLGADETFKCTAATHTTGMDISANAISDVTIAGSNCAIPSNCTATVTMDYSFVPVTPIIGTIIGNVSMSSTTTMPIERIYVSP